jgi:replicative DNA helicase
LGRFADSDGTAHPSSLQDTDCIVFLWRGEYYNITEYEDGTPTPDTILLDVAKHRNVATDEIVAACSMRRGIFQDLTTMAMPTGL